MKEIDLMKILSGVMIGVGSLLVVSSLLDMKKKKKKTASLAPKGVVLNERQKKIIKKFKGVGVVTISDTQKMFKSVTDRTLRRDLTDLVKKNVLRKEGSTKGSKYIFV